MKPIHPSNQAEFLEKLVTTVGEGISITDAMLVLGPFYLKQLELERLTLLFEEGNELSTSFHYLGYSKTIVESIKLAEIHGQMTQVFSRTAKQLKNQQALKKEAVKTLSYPVGLLFFMSVLFIVFKLFFLPIFLPIIERANPDAVSRVQLIFSLPFYMIIGCLSIAVVSGIGIVVTKFSRSDKWILNFRSYPLIRSGQNAIAGYSISKELALLLESGFTIAQSLMYLSTSHSLLVRQASMSTLSYLQRGESFSQAMKLAGWFPKAMIRYVEHGEIHGYVAKELQLYQYFTIENLQKRVSFFIAVAQPVLFLIIGALVISAYLSLMLPMYNLISL
ncbi:type II secretion system F family protein [Chryseomicrobium sp. FSL W7-1435]|uniref:type II secretion system F family protein n=1 Tax=Chryseomicrobium sp. FSL W7-1435 TaxID=2921704 RepID=UPI003159B80F